MGESAAAIDAELARGHSYPEALAAHVRDRGAPVGRGAARPARRARTLGGW